jgi:hypothetical protein
VLGVATVVATLLVAVSPAPAVASTPDPVGTVVVRYRQRIPNLMSEQDVPGLAIDRGIGCGPSLGGRRGPAPRLARGRAARGRPWRAGGSAAGSPEVETAVAERVSRVVGDVLDPDDDAAPTVRLVFRRGPLLEVLQTAARDASVLAVGRAHWCRHAALADQLRRSVDCPVVVVPAAPAPVAATAPQG